MDSVDLGASGAVGMFGCKLVFQSVVVEPGGLERVIPSHSQHAVLVLVLGGVCTQDRLLVCCSHYFALTLVRGAGGRLYCVYALVWLTGAGSTVALGRL